MFFVFLIIYYSIICAYIGFKIDKMVRTSYESYGEVNIFKEDISDRYFHMMGYRSKGNNEIDEKNWRSFPLTLVWLNKARAWYWYDYKSNLNSTRTDLYFPVIVDLEFKNFRWVITHVHDLP